MILSFAICKPSASRCRNLLVGLAIGCMSFQSAFASDCGCGEVVCGCEVSCGVESSVHPEPSCGCVAEVACGCDRSSGNCHPRKRSKSFRFSIADTPVYKSLDFLAGGIEKVLHLDKKSRRAACDDGVMCDDACDVMMLEELRAPLPRPVVMHDHDHDLVIPRPSPMPHSSISPERNAPADSDVYHGDVFEPTQRLPEPRPMRDVAPPQGLRRISTPESVSPNSSPRLPNRDTHPNQDPFADDPLGYRASVGSGLRPVSFEEVQ